jgi:hypothetical protein
MYPMQNNTNNNIFGEKKNTDYQDTNAWIEHRKNISIARANAPRVFGSNNNNINNNNGQGSMFTGSVFRN